MEIILNFVPHSEKEKLYLPYYRFFEKFYGKSIFSRYTKIALENGDVVSPFMRVIDSNFNYAVTAVDGAFNDLKSVMLGAYSPEEELLAIGRIIFGVPGNEANALVGEVILINDELTEAQRTDLYGAFISVVEKTVTEALKQIDLLTFEVPNYDAAFLTSIEELGYDIDEADSKKYLTCLFDKRIREKQIKRTLDFKTPNE